MLISRRTGIIFCHQTGGPINAYNWDFAVSMFQMI